jgi:hypothetical protein
VSQTVTQKGVPELVDTAGAAQYAAFLGIGQAPGQPQRKSAEGGENESRHTELAPGAHQHRGQGGGRHHPSDDGPQKRFGPEQGGADIAATAPPMVAAETSAAFRSIASDAAGVVAEGAGSALLASAVTAPPDTAQMTASRGLMPATIATVSRTEPTTANDVIRLRSANRRGW